MNVFDLLMDLHKNRGAALEPIGERFQALRYGSRLEPEINRILHGCGLLDLQIRPLIGVTGPEASRFLHGLFTNDINGLPSGHWQPNLFCGNKGKIKHRMEVLKLDAERLVVCCEPEEGIAVGTLLDHYLVREDVTLALLSREQIRIDLFGVKSTRPLHRLGIPGQAFTGSSGEFAFHAAPVPWGTQARWGCLVPIAVATEWIASTLDSDPECDLVGSEAVETVRIAEGLPRPGVDFGPDNFPQEVALGDHISYTKGCYIGQESHARMFHRGHPNWQLIGLRLPETAEASADAPLFHNGNEVGCLTSVSSVAQQDKRPALGWVRHAIAEAQNPVTLESGQAELMPVPLPNTIRRTVQEAKPA
ncbi:MAG: hypothetical protein CL923_08950 [Deltaproteobacteria bacterium]|jgi:folate-binding protein YgfZ|nr:hypothetical protein [Deltaproteobacteria bacterium]MDP7316581.1 hypothetical protein [SAR324 cluster bacterium]